MDSFTPRASVHENVKELRGYLGAHNHKGERLELLPRDALAAMIRVKHPTRELNGSTIQRWEGKTEPDLTSIRIMAELAGVPFQLFALGVSSATKGARVAGEKEPKGSSRRAAGGS